MCVWGGGGLGGGGGESLNRFYVATTLTLSSAMVYTRHLFVQSAWRVPHGSNDPYLGQISMVPKRFEYLRFYCSTHTYTHARTHAHTHTHIHTHTHTHFLPIHVKQLYWISQTHLSFHILFTIFTVVSFVKMAENLPRVSRSRNSSKHSL